MSETSRSFISSRRTIPAVNRSPDRFGRFDTSSQLRRIRSPQAGSQPTCQDMCSMWAQCWPPGAGPDYNWSCFCQMAERMTSMDCDTCPDNANVPSGLVQEFQNRCNGGNASQTTTQAPQSSAPTSSTPATPASTPLATSSQPPSLAATASSSSLSPQTTSQTNSTTVPEAGNASGKANIAGIAGGIVGVILFLIAAIIFWFVWRRRQQAKEASADSPVSIDHVPEVWAYPPHNPATSQPHFHHASGSGELLMQANSSYQNLTVPSPGIPYGPPSANSTLGSLPPQDLERLAERVASLITTSSGVRSDTTSWISTTEPLMSSAPPPAYGEEPIPQKRG